MDFCHFKRNCIVILLMWKQFSFHEKVYIPSLVGELQISFRMCSSCPAEWVFAQISLEILVWIKSL